jgi:hypothetical protein
LRKLKPGGGKAGYRAKWINENAVKENMNEIKIPELWKHNPGFFIKVEIYLCN